MPDSKILTLDALILTLFVYLDSFKGEKWLAFHMEPFFSDEDKNEQPFHLPRVTNEQNDQRIVSGRFVCLSIHFSITLS